MKKQISIGISLFLVLFLINGCSKSFSKDSFKDVMKDNNYAVTDISKTSSMAVGDHFIVNFYEFKDQKKAEDYVKKETKNLNYNKDKKSYILKNKYIYSIYVVNSKYVVSVSCPLKYKSEVDDIIDKLDLA